MCLADTSTDMEPEEDAAAMGGWFSLPQVAHFPEVVFNDFTAASLAAASFSARPFMADFFLAPVADF